MNKIALVTLLILLLCSSAYSQENVNMSNFEANAQFRSVQLDASSVIFITKLGAALDVDLFSNKSKTREWHALGFRLGADHIMKTNAVESYSGSPFTHINAYARFSSEFKGAGLNLFAGGAYQFVGKTTSSKKEKVYLKIGFDMKVKLKPYFGLIFNGALSSESYLGLGLYVNINNY